MWLSETPGQNSMQRNDPLGLIKKITSLYREEPRLQKQLTRWLRRARGEGNKGDLPLTPQHHTVEMFNWGAKCYKHELTTGSWCGLFQPHSPMRRLLQNCLDSWDSSPSASTAPFLSLPSIPLFSDKEQELGRENKPPQTTLTKIRILMERKKKFLFSISRWSKEKNYLYIIYNTTPTPIGQGTS